MARPLKPFIRGGGYLPSNKWTPLVYNGGYTTMDGGEEPEPPTPVYWKTITGVSPLALASALQEHIRSLTQYGKCVQEFTPSPFASADIMCNNGALRYGALGRNLLDPSAANTVLGYYIRKEDGVEKDATSNFMFAGYMPVEAGKTYVAYGRAKTGGDLADYNRVAWYDSTKTWIEGANYTQNRISVVTAPANAAYARFSCNPSGNTAVVVTQELVDSYNWMFAEGTAEIIPFVPFEGGVKPVGTPEVLTVRGINLCNPALYTGGGWYISANNTVASAASNGTLVFPCKPNTTYSWWHTSGAGGARAFELTTDEVTAGQSATWAVGNPAYNDAMTVRKYTTSADAKLLCVLFARVADQVGRTIDEQLADFMLVEGDIEEAFAYQPYHAPQTVNDVPMLLSVGDYADEAEIINGIKTGKVGVKVFDGTETIGTSNACFTIAISDRVTSKSALLCSHFPYSTKTSSQTEDMTVISFSSSNIGFRYDACADKTAFAAFLAAQYAAGTPVIVIYPLATETTEQTTPHSLNSYEGTTVVDAATNVDPVTLSVEYASSEE